MPDVLKGKEIFLGVTGSIACYKSADLASKLTQAGAIVEVAMTRSATQFIAPLTFRSLTHRYVVTDLFDTNSELSIEHVALARRADILVVAPATANTIAKIAAGMADDPITATILATEAPILIAPAMDGHMFENTATKENIARLLSRGITIVGPVKGPLASGQTGLGRMIEVPLLMDHIRLILSRNGDLSGQTIVVSAGGTEEPIDPVRVITNRSSGKMGYALAKAARDRGAHVILVTAPTAISDLVGVEMVHVNTALEMCNAVQQAAASAQALIMSAAVADYRPTSSATSKIKKGPKSLSIDLTRNPDILGDISGNFIKVGFAAESDDILENARKKLSAKNLDFIVANDVTALDSGFGTDTNRVVILDREGNADHLPLLSKQEVAHKILDRVEPLFVGLK
jgi:phosphopantothenoylcysteine decarboxylase/phosphopantothenate--cysteine ligase